MEIILLAVVVIGVGCWLTGRYLWERVVRVRDAFEEWSKDWNR